MNPEKAKSLPDNTCRHRTKTGRRCRLPVLPNSALCFRHSPLPGSREDNDDLSLELFGELPVGTPPDLTNAKQVNDCLSKAVVLLARGRISPRRAAVLTFSCSQLLRSVAAMQREEDNLPQVIVDMRRPDSAEYEAYRSRTQAHQEIPNSTSEEEVKR